MNRESALGQAEMKLVGRGPGAQVEPALRKTYHGVPRVLLPKVEPPARGLGDLLSARCSCRRFGGRPTSLEEVAVLLECAYGIFSEGRGPTGMPVDRPVPSGGARFPLELYLIVRRVEGLVPGVFHFAPGPPSEGSRLDQVRGPLPWSRVVKLFLDQSYLQTADLLVVATGVTSRTVGRYGERGFRFLWLESGHVMQNLGLAATALGLGSLPLAGFFDGPLADLLGTDLQVEPPLYAMGLGHPVTQDRRWMRRPSSD